MFDSRNPTFWLAGLLSLVAALPACDDGAQPLYPPGAPALASDLTEKVLTWERIAGADAYNLYVKTVEDCPDIEAAPFQTPTKGDEKVADVASPFPIGTYAGCDVCYYAALAAENGKGESPLSNALGWQIRTCP